jgi:hypothetical protein
MGHSLSVGQPKLTRLLLAPTYPQLSNDQLRVVLHNPGDEIFGALTARLRLRPKFKILKPVIRSPAILVMHVLEGLKRTTERLFHDVAMTRSRVSLTVLIPRESLVTLGRKDRTGTIWTLRCGWSPNPARCPLTVVVQRAEP